MKTQPVVMINIGPQQVQVQKAGQPCSCGCAPCDTPTCGVTCLEQPRFFCGQLLTDADLTKLLEWTQTKFSLSRRMHGWGVMSGLEVSLDPKNPSHVIVHPGHAVDCCGRDIVGCEPVSIDLSGACTAEECLDVEETRYRGSSKQRVNRAMYLDDAKEEDKGEETTRFDPASIFADSLALDLHLHYGTEDGEFTAALRRESCSGGAQCEASRRKETFTLSVQPAADLAEEQKAAYDEWAERLTTALRPYEDLWKNAQAKVGRGEQTQSWLLEWLERHPPEGLGFLRDWAAAVDPESMAVELPRILTLLRIDALRTWLRGGCPGCGAEEGVRVARVWLASPNAPGGSGCRVLLVDDMPPYRHAIQAEPCLPAGGRCTNLAQYLWMTWEEGQRAMRSAGVLFNEKTVVDSLEKVNWDYELRLSQATQFNYCLDDQNSKVANPVVLDTGMWGQRIIGFAG